MPHPSQSLSSGASAMNFDQLIKFAVEQGASDIHLQTGASPLLRIGGLIRAVESPPVSADELRQFIASIKPGVTAESLTGMMVEGLDFSHAVPGLCRFRCNVYSHLGTPAMVMRVVRLKVRSMDELQLPPVLRDITLSLRGLTLVTGTTGSGKTTTLAAMIDLINNAFRCKIITIEDPIEYIHTNQKAMISQLEVGRDTPSFEHGLRQALRQDPDVILVGEVRDSETMRMALRAADTGHQVFTTVHSSNAAQTIERILAMVPPEERSIATSQLAGALQAVISQRLAVTRDGGRRPAMEILRGGPGDLEVHHGEPAGRPQRLHRHPRAGHAAVRPAPDRSVQPEGHLGHRGHAAGDQPRGRGAGAAGDPLTTRRAEAIPEALVKRRDPGNAPGSRGEIGRVGGEALESAPGSTARSELPGMRLGSVAEELGDVGHDGPDVLVGQLALVGVVDLDLVVIPHQDRDVRIPGQLVVGRSAGFSEHRQRNVLDAIVLRQLAEFLARLVRFACRRRRRNS